MAVDVNNLVLPRFASDDGTADITEPSSGLKDTGWVGGATPDRPGAQHMNWLMRQNYEAHVAWRDILWYAASDTWTAHDSAFSGSSDGDIQAFLVMHNLGLILAAGKISTTTGYISSSTDGETWTSRLGAIADGAFYGMATDGTTILAVGGTNGASPKAYSSTNGTAWTDRSGFIPGTPDAAFRGVAYDGVNGLWLACTGGEQFYSTPNPTTTNWTLRKDLAVGALYTRMAHNPSSGKTIACSTANNIAQVTTDGVTWADLTTGIANQDEYVDIQYANVNGAHTWVMAGRIPTGGSGGRAMLALSTDDGVTWAALDVDTGFAFGDGGGNAQSYSIGYSPVLKHWLTFSRNHALVGAMHAFSPGDGDSVSVRNFPPVMTDFDERVYALQYVDLDSDRKNHYWLAGADADSDEMILKSGNPVI